MHSRTDVSHRHLWVSSPKPSRLLGCLHYSRVSRNRTTCVYTYDFRQWRSHHPNSKVAEKLHAKIGRCKKSGRLCSIYLPAWLFAPAVLEPGPCRVLQAMMRELTRKRTGRTDRPDRAEVIPGTKCPLLEMQRRYVALNGNGRARRNKYHGSGYRLTTWMQRAGYPMAEGQLLWSEVRQFLKDVQALEEPFGIVASGYHSGKREWQPLGRLVDLTRTDAGRKWLRECRLKVYGPEDYLVAWRRYFARALGFSYIPGGSDDGPTPSAAQTGGSTVAIKSALELDAWMRRLGLTERALAEKLGVSQATVSYQRSGRRPWSARFQERLTTLLARVAK